jgi:heme/copper-type cytochrome/quinol oxidase subunit 2
MNLAASLLACSTCRPAAGSLAAQAQDQAVLVMLVAIFFIMGVIVYTMVSFTRRARLLQAAQNAQL